MPKNNAAPVRQDSVGHPSADGLPDPTAALDAAADLAARLIDSGLPDQVVATWLLPVFVHFMPLPAGIEAHPLITRLAALVGVVILSEAKSVSRRTVVSPSVA